MKDTGQTEIRIEVCQAVIEVNARIVGIKKGQPKKLPCIQLTFRPKKLEEQLAEQMIAVCVEPAEALEIAVEVIKAAWTGVVNRLEATYPGK